MATKMCQAPCDTRPSMLIANFALANFLHKDHFDPVSWKILEVQYMEIRPDLIVKRTTCFVYTELLQLLVPRFMRFGLYPCLVKASTCNRLILEVPSYIKWHFVSGFLLVL